MKTFTKYICLFILSIITPLTAQLAAAQQQQEGNKHVNAKIIFDKSNLKNNIKSGEKISRIGILLDIEDGWHIYWRNSGSAGMPTKTTWSLPEGMTVGETAWPMPTKFAERGNITTYGYTNQVLLFSDLTSTKDLTLSDKVKFSANINWLVCKDICIPGKISVTREMQTNAVGDKPSSDAALFDQYSTMLPHTLARSKIVVETFLSTSTPQVNQEGRILMRIAATPLDKESVGANLQIFPYENKPVRLGKPLARLSKANKNEVFIEVPFVLTAPIENNFSTTILLMISGTLAGCAEDQGIEIPISFNQSASNSNFRSISESLIPETQNLTFREHGDTENTLPTPSPIQINQKGQQADASLLAVLFAAFVGGMLLNLMPCVLPIIGIKVMSFIGHKDYPRKKAISAALFFSAGIMASFFILASVVVTLRSLGYTIGWGFQFQHPQFVFVVTVIVFLLSLSFFDVYVISLPGLQQANSKLAKVESGYIKDFFDGVLATALSTPCTAPFLGSALVFAFSQPPLYSYLVFCTVGLGLALPYALCSTSPRLLRLLPKPGDWMYSLREFMGFLLLGTVIWLLFVLNKLTQEGIVWTLLILLVFYFSFWLSKIGDRSEKPSTRAITKLGALLFLAGVVFHFYPRVVAPRTTNPGEVIAGDIPWEKYSPEILARAESEGRAVFLDFTADWCITCKANEFLVIETDAVIGAIKKYNVLPVKADWTNGDEEITRALTSYGAQGVPYYVILPAIKDAKPIILPTIPSTSSLINALKTASIK